MIGTRQLEVSDPTGRHRKVNICDVHKVLPLEFIVNCIPDKQVFTRKGNYINYPHKLKEVMVIDTFLQENFTNVKCRCQQPIKCTTLVIYCKYVPNIHIAIDIIIT